MRFKRRKFNKDIGIGITTFLRNSSLYRLIESITEHLPNFKMYIVDQDKPTKFKEALYMGLEKQGHIIKKIDYDCGISNARSEIHSMVQEPFIAWMQDDFIVTENTNLLKMLDILKSNKKIGIVGGRLEGSPISGSYSYYFLKWGNNILYLPVKYCLENNIIQWQQTKKENRFIPADIVSEFTIWRKEIPNVFDSNIKVIEHSHVYLKLKYETDWTVVYTPDSEIKHYHDRCNEMYNQMRSRKDDIDYILDYWNVKELIKFTDVNKYKFLLNNNNWHYSISNKEDTTIIKSDYPKKTQPNKKEKERTFKTFSQDKTKSSSLNMNTAKTYNILNDFINIIQKFAKNCYLANRTCLEGVINKRIETSPLHLSIPKLNDYELQYLKNKGYNYENNSFIKDNFIIEINHKIPKKFKTVNCDNFKYLVPMPVVGYLNNLYPNWQEIKEE